MDLRKSHVESRLERLLYRKKIRKKEHGRQRKVTKLSQIGVPETKNNRKCEDNVFQNIMVNFFLELIKDKLLD